MEIKHILRNLCKFCIAFWGAVTRIRLRFCLGGTQWAAVAGDGDRAD